MDRTLKIEILYSKWFFVQPTRPSFGQAPGWVEEKEKEATGWLATFPWNIDIHGRSIDKRGKKPERGDFYTGIRRIVCNIAKKANNKSKHRRRRGSIL